ncbi:MULTISPECIES: SGNH hydrolase domain-containing protein [unclassified Arthrobacter]|uniref:SGNH hydrolase domain-containing protein n=1 Tax=unclassified Arthrobacter TaxID=235627 RepID=UPI0011AFEF12|nr:MULTISPECIES: SGNH hydrolase domain-containing protein [unclassified Arthrobacter]
MSRPSDCTAVVSPEWEMLKAAESTVAATKAAVFVDTKPWFCVQDACPSFAGNRAIFADPGHLTGAFSAELAPVMAEALNKAQMPGN